MAERPWMPMFWGDYVRDTLHLNNAQHGAYLMLIAAYWISGKPLPDNNAELARIARCSPNWWRQNRVCLLRFFERNECGQWVHKRVEKELLRASVRSASASASAKQRARATTTTVTEIVGETPPSLPTDTSYPPAGSPPQGGNGLDHGISKAKAKAAAESVGTRLPKAKAATAEPRGTRLPEDWEPGSEGIEYAQELGLSAEQIRDSYGAFMRHWLAKAGSAGRKLRWDLTWQTWVRNDVAKLREKAERERQRAEAWQQQRR